MSSFSQNPINRYEGSTADITSRMAGLGIHQQEYEQNQGYPPNDYPSHPYQHFAPQYDSYSPACSVETMHGMPSYPFRPPVTRSTQTSPMNPPSQAYSRPSTAGGYGMWTSPPMSPAVGYQHSRQPSYVEEFGGNYGMRMMGMNMQGPMHRMGSGQGYQTNMPYHDTRQAYPPSTWNTPSTAYSAPFYTPYQPQTPTMDSQRFPRQRQSVSGPSRESPEKERKAYHPQPPSRRSDWVMWVGNVPPNTSHEELWRFFNSTNPYGEGQWRGPSSIFLISRSSCAFVNLSCQDDLERAVAFFNGRPLRPYDPRCPRMVCRIRHKDDDLRAGVGAQRGTGMHREWVKAQPTLAAEPPSPAILEHPPDGEGRRRESIVDDAKHKSSSSFASTNSSFLLRHFPRRVFILKSLTTAELEESVKTSTWRTQRHNGPILDQAFRTSQEVFLIFGANRSGEFFGYAKMVEPIDKTKKASKKPHPIKEEEEERGRAGSEPIRPTYLLTPSQGHIAACSPSEISPAEDPTPQRGGRNTDPVAPSARPDHNNFRAKTHDPKKTEYFPPMPIALGAAENEAEHQQALGSSSRPVEVDGDGVARKDTVLTTQEKEERDEPEESLEGMGQAFRIQWVKVGSLPFGRTRLLRNPWNADREVKVSRDGTEVEPTVGSQLMAEWENPGTPAAEAY